MTLNGGCLCGGVKYEITGPVGGVMNCHCSMCRKSSGAAFLSGGPVAAKDFRWVKGEEMLARYESSPGGYRVFCRKCGSSLAGMGTGDGPVWIALGSLDDDPGVRPWSHIYVGSKAQWYEISDDLPRFDEFPAPK